MDRSIWDNNTSTCIPRQTTRPHLDVHLPTYTQTYGGELSVLHKDATEDSLLLTSYLTQDQEPVKFEDLTHGDIIVMWPIELKQRLETVNITRCTGEVIATEEDPDKEENSLVTVQWLENEESLILENFRSTEPRWWVDDVRNGVRRVKKKTLTCILGEILSKPDAPGSTEIDVRGMHTLFIRTMRDSWAKHRGKRRVHSWAKTREMFEQMDVDRTGKINIGEIVSYCNAHEIFADQVNELIPKSCTEWVWVFIAPTGSHDVFNPYNAILSAEKSLSPAVDTVNFCGNELNTVTMTWLLMTFKLLSQAMIMLSAVILVWESLPEEQQRETQHHYSKQGNTVTFALDIMCTSWFTLECFMWFIGFPYHFKHRNWILEQETWVNVLSILPFYIYFIVPTREGNAYGEWPDILTSLRICRVVRLLKLAQALKCMLFETDIFRVTKAPKLMTALGKAIVPLFWLFLLVATLGLLLATIYFYSELYETHFDHTQSKWVRNNVSRYSDANEPVSVQSIPEAFYYAVVTLTTVGYGDISPITEIGKVVACSMMLISMVVYSLPITIIGSTFAEMYVQEQGEFRIIHSRRDFCHGLTRLLQQIKDDAEEDHREGTSNAEEKMELLRQLVHWDSELLTEKRDRRQLRKKERRASLSPRASALKLKAPKMPSGGIVDVLPDSRLGRRDDAPSIATEPYAGTSPTKEKQEWSDVRDANDPRQFSDMTDAIDAKDQTRPCLQFVESVHDQTLGTQSPLTKGQ